MRIICDTTFLDGSDRFEKGDTRTVDDKRGAYFVKLRWAHEAGTDAAAAPEAGDVTLDTHSGKHGQEARHG